MSEDNKIELAARVVTQLTMAAITYGLMLWAAAEVEGLLRWLLLGWVAFNVSVVFIAATVRQAKKGTA